MMPAARAAARKSGTAWGCGYRAGARRRGQAYGNGGSSGADEDFSDHERSPVHFLVFGAIFLFDI